MQPSFITLLEINKHIKVRAWVGGSRASFWVGDEPRRIAGEGNLGQRDQAQWGGAYCPGGVVGKKSLLLGAPGDVVRPRGCMILIDKLLHNLSGSVQLVEVLLEDVLLAELLQEGLPFPQLVILLAGTFKELKEIEISTMGAGTGQRVGTDWGE